MCTICKNSRVSIYLSVRYFDICKNCYNIMSFSNNQQLSTFIGWITALRKKEESFDIAVDSMKSAYLNKGLKSSNIKDYTRDIASYKRDINRLEGYIESNISIVYSLISVYMLFNEISDKERVTAKEIVELYDIKDKAFMTYKKHIKADRNYKYTKEDISYLMNIQSYYDIKRNSRYSKIAMIQARTIQLHLLNKIGLELN